MSPLHCCLLLSAASRDLGRPKLHSRTTRAAAAPYGIHASAPIARGNRTEHRHSLDAICRRGNEVPDKVAAMKKIAACRRRRGAQRQRDHLPTKIPRRRLVADVAATDSDSPCSLLYGARTVSDGSPSARMIVVVSMLTSRAADSVKASLPRAANSDSQTAFALHGRIDVLERLLDLLSFRPSVARPRQPARLDHSAVNMLVSKFTMASSHPLLRCTHSAFCHDDSATIQAHALMIEERS
ncbi:hypothetical protein V8E36_001880 [Tilletia maclaganii]